MQQQETSGENQAPVHSQFGVTLYDDRVTPPPPYPGQVESGQFAEPMTSLPPTDDLPPRYSQAVHDEYHTTTPLPLQPSQQQQQQQQQQQIVFVTATQQCPTDVEQQDVQSFDGTTVLSCLVFWFINPLFGLAACVLAATANQIAVSDPRQTKKLGRNSTVLSVVGIIVSALTVLIVVPVVLIRNQPEGHCRYVHDGNCYRYKTRVGTSGICAGNGVISESGDCYSDHCSYYKFAETCYKYRTNVGNRPTASCLDGVSSSDGYCYYSCPKYDFAGSCYKYREHVGSSGTCNGDRSPDNFCYYAVCPYYLHGDVCYRYKTYVGDDPCIGGVKSLFHHCYSMNCAYYEYDGYCYQYRMYVGSSRACRGVTSPDRFCYYSSCTLYTYRDICYSRFKISGGRTGPCAGVRSPEGICYYN